VFNQEQHIVQICPFNRDLSDDSSWTGLRTYDDAISFVSDLDAFNHKNVIIWIGPLVEKFYRIRSDKMTTTYQRFI